MKRVLLDVDGVLADFIGAVCKTIEWNGGPKHTPEDVTAFDFIKVLNLSPEVARDVKREISMSYSWWSSLEVFPGAVEGVAALREVADVYIVTSPWNSCPTWLHDREAWLRRHFDIPHSRVIAGSAKHLISGDVLVDDKTETLYAWHQGFAGRRAVQWITPHNRLDGWTGHATRSWGQLLEWCR